MGLLSKLFGGNNDNNYKNGQGAKVDEDYIYVDGEMVWLDQEAKDFLREYQYYISYAEANNPEAQLAVGKCLYNYAECFWYGVKHINEAVIWLKKAAEQGQANAYTYLGRYYSNERYENINIKQSLRYLKRAAELNDAEAYYYLGELYYLGKYLKKDDYKAIRYKTKAADLGNLDAVEDLGCAYYEGEIISEDKNKAFMYLKTAFEHGRFFYGYYLACCYLRGEGVKENPSEAVKVLQNICDGKFRKCQKEAENLLIHCYENGIGIAVNYSAAEQIRMMQEEKEKLWDDFSGLFSSKD